MTPEAIRAVYDQGPEAVIVLVTQLYEVVAQLSARVAALEAQIAKDSHTITDSHNSSKPPSTDGLSKPAPKSLRQKSGQRPGGQKGHPGSSLHWSQTPDQIIEHRPKQCAACGKELAQTTGIETTECRQVHDLPSLHIMVTEHRACSACCPACQSVTRASFPAGVPAPVQYGPQIKALGVYLSCYQLLPFARSSQLLGDLLGVSFSPGTLCAAQTRCAEALAPVEEQIKTALTRAPVLHLDETGVRIAGKLHWLHVASTAQLTHYATHPKRGRAATDAMGLLPAFAGTAVHDGWAPYRGYACRHGLCNAHHLRELTFLAEEEGLLWAQAMKRLLLTMKAAVDQVRATGATGLSPPALSALELSSLEHRYTQVLAQGRLAHPPAPATGKRGRARQSKGRNLLERLSIHRTATLAFVRDLSVPFDNNQAERDVRMMKLRLKISGCFRTPAGADVFCRIRGYLSTMQKQGQNAWAVLTALLEGQTICPTLST